MRKKLILLRTTWFLFIPILAGAVVACRNEPNGSRRDLSASRVSIVAPAVRVTAGGSTATHVAIRVAEGYHIQANPASDPYLISAEIGLAKHGDAIASRPAYPAGKPYRLEGSPDALSVYDGETEIGLEITASPDLEPGDYRFEGAFQYQVCDHKTCFPPATQTFALYVRVSRSDRQVSDLGFRVDEIL